MEAELRSFVSREMEKKQKNLETKPKDKYVWDPNKLTWVEAPEQPGAIEEPAEEAVAQPDGAELTDQVLAESETVEAVPRISALPYGGVLIRIGVNILDLVILFIIMYVISRFVHSLPREAALGLSFVYFVGFWAWRGQTLGKMLAGLKVVKADGSRVDIVRAVLRYLFYLVPAFGPVTFYAAQISAYLSYILIIATIVVMSVNPKKRGIHDLIAGTSVIYARAPGPEPETVKAEIGEFSDISNSDADDQNKDRSETENQE
jgi:uncharacterized RDD family membrane protein YckC